MTKYRNALAIAAMAAWLAAPLSAQRPGAAQVTLKQATDKEMVDGDLKGAIALYQKSISQAGNDRAIAVKALLRMAQCHEKLGDAEARKIYERVVREYGDQKDAVAMARTRLGGRNSAVLAKGDRVVWTGKNAMHVGGSVSADGRFISYTDWWDTGNLMLHDLASGATRPLTGNKDWRGEGNSEGSAFCKDSRQVAYGWLIYSPRHCEIRIVNIGEAGVPQPRRVRAFDTEEIGHVSVSDWSPDQKSLAVRLERRDRSVQIGIVAVADGALRVLKTVNWRGPGKMLFSPDNKYLAYDLPAGDTALQRDVFVIAVDGSREVAAVVHPANDAVMGWSPDGSHLLFSSDRNGSAGLWELPIGDGKSHGDPKLLKPDIGPVSSLGVTASGALQVFKDTSTQAMHIAPIDLDSGKLLGVAVAQAYRSSRPDWSPDGKYLAFKTTSDGVNLLSIQSVESGQVRNLPPSLTYFSEPRWAPDARWLVAGARDLKGGSGIYRFDAATGAVSFLSPGSHTSRVNVSPDGKKIYYDYYPGRRGAFVEYDLVSGATRDIFQPPAQTETGNLELSPDGRFAGAILRKDRDPSAEDNYGNTSTVLMIPIAGGEAREVLRVTRPERFEAYGGMTWTPDSRAVLVMKTIRDRKELWLVPLNGSARKLDIDVSDWHTSPIRLHPNGKQIAFFAGTQSEEIWSLENFLPGLRATR